jgi:hypothetical protein
LYYTGIDRDYPDVPNYFKDKKEDEISIIPQYRLGECAWCPNIVYVWPESYREEENRLIDLVALEHLVANDNDVWLKALTVVVRDAVKNNVQVLLRMIPFWLRDKILGKLRKGNCLLNNHSTISNHINVSTYYAHRGVDDQSLMQILSSKTNNCLLWEEGQFDLQVEPIALGNHSVVDIPGFSIPYSGAIFYVNDENILRQFLSQKGFISEKELNTKRIWLTYDPANRRNASASCWHIQKHIHLDLQQDNEKDNNDAFIEQDKPVAIFPAWTAMPNGKNRFFYDFVPPASDNRVQYWVDALYRLLSLENTENFKGVYVLLVTHPHEKDIITTALCEYGVTIPFGESPLRHLESLRRNKKKFAVDIIECANQWLVASEAMNCEIQLVIESLPIYEWWIYLNAATEITCADTFDEIDDESNEAMEDDSDINQNIELEPLYIAKQANNEHYGPFTPVMLTHDAVQSCIEHFLKPWLSKVMHGQVPMNSPIILDCRFDRFNFKKSAHFARYEFVVKPLAQPQKESLLRFLREAMGDIERQDPPTDYETYRKFFTKHWSDKDRII